MVEYVKLVVIGGSSPATPVLLLALDKAIAERRLPAVHVALWGRNELRLNRICEYVDYARNKRADGLPITNGSLSIRSHISLDEALKDGTHILCQIRPGGMERRAQDEGLALNAGLPADEAIGPGGLSAFLRGRQTMERMLQRCATVAPSAVFFQMTSPLSLMTALVSDYYPKSAYGICELPTTTLQKIFRQLEGHFGFGSLHPALAGLNHRSWFYDFRDNDGDDRTTEVLNLIDGNELVAVDSEVIRHYGAIPVHYLSLFLHPNRHVQAQRRAGVTRGSQLVDWSRRLDREYCRPLGLKPDRVRGLLYQRTMNWYEDGVIPALIAFLSPGKSTLPLNMKNTNSISGVPTDAILETYCEISDGRAVPLAVPPMPQLPARLTAELVNYEKSVLKLPVSPSPRHIRKVLAQHPLCNSSELGELAERISWAATDE